MFIVKMADHDGNHRCLVETIVPIALILPSRWRDGAQSLAVCALVLSPKCNLPRYMANT